MTKDGHIKMADFGLSKKNIDKTKETGQHKTFAAQRKKKVIAYQKKEWGIEVKEMLMHKSWITKIKYYPDL